MKALLVLFVGCSLVACSGFGAARHMVLTDGSAQTLPAHGTHIMIWAPTSVSNGWGWGYDQAKMQMKDAATIWLQQRGMVLIGQSRQAILSEQAFRAMTYNDRIRVGELTGAQVIVFQHLSDTFAHLTFQAVDVQSGEVLWIGSASTAPEFTRYGERWGTREPIFRPDVLRALACAALRTAWGLQTPGPHALEEQGCTS